MKKPIQTDIDTIQHVLRYCDRIVEYFNRFGDDFDTFCADHAFRDSVCMNILQIGEMVGHLSKDFCEKTGGVVSWKSIRAMRNIFAHDYGNVDNLTVWNSAKKDIPELKSFCERTLEEHGVVLDESIEEENDIVFGSF